MAAKKSAKPQVQDQKLTLQDELRCKQCGKTFVREDLLFVGAYPGVPRAKRPDGMLRPCDVCSGRDFEVSAPGVAESSVEGAGT